MGQAPSAPSEHREFLLSAVQPERVSLDSRDCALRLSLVSPEVERGALAYAAPEPLGRTLPGANGFGDEAKTKERRQGVCFVLPNV